MLSVGANTPLHFAYDSGKTSIISVRGRVGTAVVRREPQVMPLVNGISEGFGGGIHTECP